MTESTRKELLALANKAADEFANGNVVGAIGIVGVFFTIAAMTTLLVPDLPGQQLEDVRLQFAFLCGANGALLVLLSGLMFLYKAKIRHEAMMTFAEGYFRVTVELTSKVNPGTVSADNVITHADNYFKSALSLLSMNKDTENTS